MLEEPDSPPPPKVLAHSFGGTEVGAQIQSPNGAEVTPLFVGQNKLPQGRRSVLQRQFGEFAPGW